MEKVIIILSVILGIVIIGFFGYILYNIRQVKPIRQLANQTRIDQCEKLDTIIKIQKIMVDNKLTPEEKNLQVHELSSQCISTIKQHLKEVSKKMEDSETSDKEILSKILELVKSIKLGDK